MAIITATTYQSATSQTISGADATALAVWCLAVDAAIKAAVRPYVVEAATFTDKVCDAPVNNVLHLPVYPVRSITSLYLRYGAGGDPSAFESGDLLTQYEDYFMPIDQPNGYSTFGRVFRLGVPTWGYQWRRPVDRLAGTLDPARGAIKYTVAAGPLTVPDDIFAAAVLAVSLMFARKKTGLPTTNESWNGYSYGTASAFTATAAVQSPDVQALLLPYMTVRTAGA